MRFHRKCVSRFSDFWIVISTKKRHRILWTTCACKAKGGIGSGKGEGNGEGDVAADDAGDNDGACANEAVAEVLVGAATTEVARHSFW